MKFTQMPAQVNKKIQLNAGFLTTTFDPSDPIVDRSAIIGATSGGSSFEAKPNFSDFGDGIDNCPKNTMELKRLDDVEVKISGTFITMDADLAEKLMAAADTVTASGLSEITPRADLDLSDFQDLWWIGDYSDKNGATNGGYIAIEMLNTLSTGGLKVKVDDKKKGQFDFEFTAHYSMNSPQTIPYKIYIQEGASEAAPTYSAATLTSAGFAYGVTYYTRTGSGTTQSPYVYTEVSANAVYDSSKTYYTKD